MVSGAFAVVDLETTGCNPQHDHITEIAILGIRAGRITDRWSQLVDPGVPIPASIQALTGINDAMVAGQPAFADIAGAVHERLSGATFVAHNARFDHGFLRHALRRCGFALSGPVLCTVRLSRRLFPRERYHNLDALIERHGLHCSARHRALGDAEATWAFLETVAASYPDRELARHIAELCRPPELPPQLDAELLDAMPHSPGVYIFFDERDAPVYVGRSDNLYAGVMAHLTGAAAGSRATRLARLTARVHWQRTAGPLGALLRATRLARDLAPRCNRRRGSEPATDLPAWPWPGPVAVCEADPGSEREEVHVVDRWCHLGSFRSEQELWQADFDVARATPDAEIGRLLARHLLRFNRARIVPLGAPARGSCVLSHLRARV